MPRRPRTAICVAVALAFAFAGCGGGEAHPTASTTQGSSTVATELQDETAAVVKAYIDHWPVFDAFLNGTPPGDPADYFTGARLADLPRSVADFAARGLEIRGQAQLDPGPVTIKGNTASFTDCQLDLSRAVSKSTGEVVFPPAAAPQEVEVEVVRSGGVWKVSSVVYVPDSTCTQ